MYGPRHCTSLRAFTIVCIHGICVCARQKLKVVRKFLDGSVEREVSKGEYVELGIILGPDPNSLWWHIHQSTWSRAHSLDQLVWLHHTTVAQICNLCMHGGCEEDVPSCEVTVDDGRGVGVQVEKPS